MQLLKDISRLFYPDLCLNCDKNLLYKESILCSFCRHDLPQINLKNYQNNEITDIFYGRTAIKKGASFLYFRKKGITKQLIHHLKYKNRQDVGTFIGNWFGYELDKSNEFKNIDYIVPVPLHSSKLKKRGYNQLTTFGNSLSTTLKTPYLPDVLLRISSTKTQTFKKRFERFSSTTTKFNLTNTSVFENKHVLLIDDVITTGATLEACCNELLKSKNITISIITMAFTEKT
ncbi:ComF family protein [Tenacibaculum adriaticum]|uniref:ComF family protein n=1 Tax=Tenacibaculum adriaticum TaxID=413713 RepID=A0A5S5DUV1_9FLAO|nr:phosphoribosyltransferase family protein [Tenacibaculum adriaticum]TYP99770.1 ComF family protein [Tenacibaculum adriaticum]